MAEQARQGSYIARFVAALRTALAVDPTRVHWIDCVKGITILLVVFHHAQDGVDATIGLSETFNYYYKILSPVRMPLFFLVAGLFAARAINGPLRSFLDGKILHFAYFYLLWSAIIFAFRYGLSGLANNKMRAEELLMILWDPLPTIWFLYALLLAFAAMRLLRGVAPAYVVGFAAVVQAHYFASGPTGIVIVDKFSYVFVYFAIGVYASEWIRAQAAKTTVLRWLAACAVFGLAAAYFRSNDLIHSPLGYFTLSAASAAAIIGTAWLGTRAGLLKPIVIVGNHSFEIYLTHFASVAATRIVLMKLGVTEPVVIFAAAILSAVVFALVLGAATRGTFASFLFERPRFLRLRGQPVAGAD